MADDEGTPQRFDELRERVRQARERTVVRTGIGGPREGIPGGMMGAALRIGVELVVATGVGVGLGFVIDHLSGTSPWGLIVMFFLGGAAGIRNVYRAAEGLSKIPAETGDAKDAGRSNGHSGTAEASSREPR